MAPRYLYEFGPFRIDVALSRLERAGQPIPLPPKAFDLLLLLVRNTDRVLSKTELMETLWPNTFVEESNLTQHVYTLRKALGEQPSGLPYIDTVPRRGYRLATQVREVTGNRDVRTDEAPQADPAARPTALEGERKHATVMDVRISNAAAVVERFGPDALTELTGDLVKLGQDEIERYEGVISRVHPDGFVALFGARVVHEDDARRACLSALAVAQRFRALPAVNAMGEDPADLQIGISTGPVVVTPGSTEGVVQCSAVGEACKWAELLQQLAGPGTILISDSTRRSIETDIEVAPTALQVAGGSVFRLLRHAGRTARPHRLSRTLTPFVGRRHELALLAELAAEAGSGRGQVVSIVGEPGIGKSRLLYELNTQLRSQSSTVLEGRCVSYGTLVPYLPLTDVIRSYCGVSDADDPETIRRSIGSAVEATGIPPKAATWLLRLIGVIESGSAVETLTPEAIKSRTFDALRALLLRASTQQPLVIVVEDLHWIDRTSEEFLVTLAERIIPTRILLITTYRPGYRPPWMDRSYASQITLKPLPPDAGAQLVHSVSMERPLPASMSEMILEKADGNPFFLEELARTIVERGPDTQHIPDTVQGVIMARIDRLPASAKQLLQTASVLGREVAYPLLERVWSGGDMTSDLATLCRLEFLYERLSGDGTILVFKHALTQDVAYDSLLTRHRRDLHLRAARALAELYGERNDLAARFAYHYSRTDLVDDAVVWLTRAADEAARVYANAEAILHLDLAARKLQRLPEGPDRDRRMIQVALQHAHSLYFLGRFPESVQMLLPHEARLARLNDRRLAAAYSFWLAHMYSRLGDQERAAECALRAIEAADAAGDHATLGKAHGLLALEGHWAGRPAEGIENGQKSVKLLVKFPEHRWWLGMSHFYLSVNSLLEGNFDAALSDAAAADSVGQEIGDPRLQTYAGFVAAWAEASRGNTERAVEIGRRSVQLAPDRVSRAYASLFLAYALVEHQDPEEAQRLLEPVLVELESFAFPQWHGLAAILMADALRSRGEIDRASLFAQRGLRVTTSARYWYGVGFGHRTVARIAGDDGRQEEARAAFDQAAAVFDRIGATFEAARTRLEAARTSSSGGESTASDIVAAAKAFQKLNVPKYIEQASKLVDPSR